MMTKQYCDSPPKKPHRAYYRSRRKKESHRHRSVHPPWDSKDRIPNRVTESSALNITPIVENPDPRLSGVRYLDRTKLEQLYFGAYYFFPDWGFFRITTNTGGLPPDYFSPQKSTVVPPDKITSFLEEHGEILKTEPSVLMDPALLERKTVENYQQVTIDHKEVNEEGVTLE